jgi:hypothetical protein
VLTPKQRYSPQLKATILNAYRERMSLRGRQRVFGVWRSTLLPAQAGDVLEMDECMSFVSEKFFKHWLWTYRINIIAS